MGPRTPRTRRMEPRRGSGARCRTPWMWSSVRRSSGRCPGGPRRRPRGPMPPGRRAPPGTRGPRRRCRAERPAPAWPSDGLAGWPGRAGGRFAAPIRVGGAAPRRSSAAARSGRPGASRSAVSTAAATRAARSAAGWYRLRRLGQHLRDDRLRGRSGERRLAGEHLVEHAAQGVDVGAGGDLALAHRLLGAHVVRRAERHAGLGHPVPAGLAGGERDAEVGHQRAPVVQQDVLRLDVAVDHAVPVGVVERVGHLGARSGPRRPSGAASRG